MAKKSTVIPDELQTWYDRIKNAEQVRSKVSKQYGWDRIKRELKGEYKSVLGGLKGTPVIPINLVHAFIRTAVPSLYFRDPKFSCNPNGAQYIPRARIGEAVLNAKWQNLKMKREMRKCIADAIGWAGHAWMKCGYTPIIGKKEESKIKKKELPQYETDTVIKNEKIWAYRVSPNMVAFNNDESVDPPYDCRWIAHEIHRPLSTVKVMYPGNDDLKASFTSSFEASKDSDSSRLKSYTGSEKSESYDRSGIEMVRLYEITDMDADNIHLLADGYFKPILDPRSFPYDFTGFNWSMLKFNDVPDEPYPYGDIYAAEPQIWEIIKLMSMALNHVKRFNRQLTIGKGSMSEGEKAKLTQGIDGALIEMDKAGEQPQPIQYPQLQPDIYNILDRLQLLFDNIVGQSAFDRGSTTATKSRTLGEVGIIQRSTGTRSSEKLDTVEEFSEEVAEKVLSLVRQYQDTPEFIAITGINPQEMNRALKAPVPEMEGKMSDDTGFWYTKNDLEGKYDISVVAGSTKPLDHEYRNELLVQVLRFGQALGLQPGDPASNEIGRELFNGLDMLSVGQAFEQKVKSQEIQNDINKLNQAKQQLTQQVMQLQKQGQAAAAQLQQMTVLLNGRPPANGIPR